MLLLNFQTDAQHPGIKWRLNYYYDLIERRFRKQSCNEPMVNLIQLLNSGGSILLHKTKGEPRNHFIGEIGSILKVAEYLR